MSSKLSIIIPTYRGGNWIAQTVSSLLREFPETEIIVVDDGSLDNTQSVLSQFSDKIKYLKNAVNSGKGYSLREGVKKAQGEYMIFTDSDLPFGIDSIKRIYELLVQGNQFIIGERHSFYNDKFYKRLLRPFLYFILKLFFHLSYRDTQCGIKGFSREAAKQIFSCSFINKFAIDIELLYIAQIKSIPVKSISVQQKSWTPSTFHLDNIIKMFWDLIRIKFHSYRC